MNSTQRIICICSGNICRSPMAVAMLRYKLDRRQVPAMVISGGTLGIQGRRADEFARLAIAERSEAMREAIDEHRSQGISTQMLKMADHLMVMAPRHARYVHQHAPPLLKRVVRLWEYADGEKRLSKIPDPVGQDAEVFRLCRNLIENCLDNWLDEAFGAQRSSESSS